MHILGVAEMKTGLVSFHFDKHGAYLLFAIGIYQVWWPRAKWQGNICRVAWTAVESTGEVAAHLCGVHRKRKILQTSVRGCALELSWFNPYLSALQSLLGATPGHNRDAGRAFPALLSSSPAVWDAAPSSSHTCKRWLWPCLSWAMPSLKAENVNGVGV